jgi:hypothetical protein
MRIEGFPPLDLGEVLRPFGPKRRSRYTILLSAQKINPVKQ